MISKQLKFPFYNNIFLLPLLYKLHYKLIALLKYAGLYKFIALYLVCS